ncbi:hypothetical protein DFQ27_003196 [Actinomortierella ambigua]|uniref:Uncharacterized protein n=1 Tax=Actinomortierella ambigua TaxID=1343610 RepID=A0A9P6QI75_9FUNG|nr:hypothetical protein DFQ27_003196 [Actinomortierella ambigua]
MKFTSILGALAVATLAVAFEFDENPFSADLNKCIPEISIKEYESFNLMSNNLKTYLSTPAKKTIHMVVGGQSSQVDSTSLEMCVTSTDTKCNPPYKTNCIYDNVDYVFRVEKPVRGYLKVVGTTASKRVVVITEHFRDATPLNFYKEAGWGLRIAERLPNGDRMVFETTSKGQPVTLNKPVKDLNKQWFEIKSRKPRSWDLETCEEESLDLMW